MVLERRADCQLIIDTRALGASCCIILERWAQTVSTYLIRNEVLDDMKL